MSSLRSNFVRKRRSDDESSDSDSGADSPPVKRPRTSYGDSNFKEVLTTKCQGIVQWISSLPIKRMFKDKMLKRTLLQQPMDSNTLNENATDGETVEDDADLIDIADDDSNEAGSHRPVTRSYENGIFYLPTSAPLAYQSERNKNMKCRPFKPLKSCPTQNTLLYPIRQTRSARISSRSIINAPETDIEILLDTRDAPVEESDELEIVSEMARSKHMSTRSQRTVSPSYKCPSSRSNGSNSHTSLLNGKAASPYHRKEKQATSQRFTALQLVRLEEKEQYKLLLDKMINNSIYRPVKRHVQIEVDLTGDEEEEKSTVKVPDPPFKKETVQKPVDEFLKKYYNPCKLVSPVTPTPDLNDSEVRAPDEDEIRVVKEVNSPDYRPNSKKKSLFFSPDWIAELKSTINSETETRLKKVKDQEEKIERFKQRRDAKLAEEKLFREQLKIGGFIYESIEDDEFPAITDEMNAQIDAAFQVTHNNNISAVSEHKVQVNRNDLLTLVDDSWLNDEVINFYLALIAMRSKKDPSLPQVHCFNTFFFTNMNSRGISTVLRWTKKIDIFSFDLLIVPVHLGVHWALLVVDNRCRKIRFYDSMHGPDKGYLSLMQRYLVVEMKDKKKMTIDPNTYATEVVKDIPLQMNGSDCGMFSTKYAEYLSRDAPITFNQGHMSYFRRKMMYEIISQQLL